MKKYDLALRDYNEAIRRNPKFAPAYEMRGDANFNLQQYGRAIDDFNRNISLKPNNAQSYVRRGAVYESLKQYDKAIQDYDQAIRLDPGHARTYTRRANAKKLSGDLSGAAADQRYRATAEKAIRRLPVTSHAPRTATTVKMISLDGSRLTFDEFRRVAQSGEPVQIDPAALPAMLRSRARGGKARARRRPGLRRQYRRRIARRRSRSARRIGTAAAQRGPLPRLRSGRAARSRRSPRHDADPRQRARQRFFGHPARSSPSACATC